MRAGKLLLLQARKILNESRRMHEIVHELNEHTSCRLKIGVIPTLAPYLLLYFVKPLLEQHPELEVHIEEMNTQTITESWKKEQIDVGILVTPLQVSLVALDFFPRQKLLYALQNEILQSLPESLKKSGGVACFCVDRLLFFF